MSYKIEYIPEAVNDLNNLDDQARDNAHRVIGDLSENPFLGTSLGIAYGIDLSGIFKVYCNHREHRIIYRFTDDWIEIVAVMPRKGKEELQRIVASGVREMRLVRPRRRVRRAIKFHSAG